MEVRQPKAKAPSRTDKRKRRGYWQIQKADRGSVQTRGHRRVSTEESETDRRWVQDT